MGPRGQAKMSIPVGLGRSSASAGALPKSSTMGPDNGLPTATGGMGLPCWPPALAAKTRGHVPLCMQTILTAAA